MIITTKANKLLLLISNRNNYGLKISRAGKLQITGIRETLKKFSDLGIIKYTTINKRTHYLELTEKGKEVQSELRNIQKLLLQRN